MKKLTKIDIKYGFLLGIVLVILGNAVNIKSYTIHFNETVVLTISLFALAFGFGCWCVISYFYINNEKNNFTLKNKNEEI